MLKCVPFQPEHAARIRLQPSQRDGAALIQAKDYKALARLPSITMLDGDEVLAFGGVITVWPGRAICWASLAESIGHRMTFVIRTVKEFLTAQNPGRLEMDVQVDHPEGHRFACLLGFVQEIGRLRSYYPDGSDGALYAQVKA